jgi:arylamine N-acetyltransferase
MIEKVVSDIEKALNRGTFENEKPLHHTLADAIEESAFVWRKDYTIAVAKDDSKTKVANLMVCNKLDETEQTFKVKREKDFWKKLQPRNDYEAVVECSSFSSDTTLREIETEGRDLMRSRKEVPTVSAGGFVWVVKVEAKENLNELFQLYFKENYLTLEQEKTKFYIGWTDNLKTLDMRHFVCDPTAPKVG